MSYIYKSNLAPYIYGVLQQKHTLGFSYDGGAFNFSQFDKLCLEKYPNEKTLTKEIALDWATIRSTETKGGFAGRLCAIRELARYMNREGVDSYVIPFNIGSPPHKTFVPHIFSTDELIKLFNAADNIIPNPQYPINHLVIPVIFRLMLTCGLRPQEALPIKCKDVNLKEGTIFIPEGKRSRDRIIVMSTDMQHLCKRFNDVIHFAYPDREFFFPGNRTPHPTSEWLRNALFRMRRDANLLECTGNTPRPYDFRHTFSTRTLFRWLNEGRDLNNCLPYLSVYMGHSKFESTSYYIHLIPEFFPQMKELVCNNHKYLIPEVSEFEDN